MKYKFTTSILLSLIFLLTNCKNETNKALTNTNHNTIDFELTKANNISVKSILNDSDTLDLMFHLAVDDITIIEDSLHKVPSVIFGDTIDIKSWGGTSESLFSTNNKFKIGDIEYNDANVFVSKHSGHFTDGKFGINFFSSKILNIDFDKSKLLVLDSLPNNINTYKKSKLKIENGKMFVESEISIDNIKHKKWLLLHSGYSKNILLDDKFVAENNLNQKLKTISESELKDSYGNILKTKEVKLEKISINDISLINQNVGIFEGEISNQSMSIIGCGILKKFNILIDYQEQNLYLKKNKYFDVI